MAAAPALLQGCMRGCSSSEPPVLINRSMFNQPKYKAQAASDFFYDGKTMRSPVAGTVARGQLHEDTVLFTGKSADGSFVAKSPLAPDEAVLARGAERFAIYCAPCHDARGEGKGILATRAKVPTANLLEPRIRDLPDGQIFDVISNGKGLMQPYRYPISPRDRWAIIAHVRALEAAQAREEAQR